MLWLPFSARPVPGPGIPDHFTRGDFFVTERPTKLPWNATLVVRACGELSLVERLVWLEDHAFDRGPEGAYVSAAAMSARWAGEPATRTIEDARGRLKRLGLHEAIRRPGARNEYGWFATMPAGCVPIEARPTPADVARYARKLADHIRRVGDPVLARAQSPPHNGVRPRPSTGSDPVPGRGQGAERVLGGGQGGGLPSFASSGETPLHPAVTVSRQDGVGSHEPKGEDGEAERSEISDDVQPRAVDQRPADDVFEDGMAAIAAKRRAFHDAAADARKVLRQ